MRAWTWGAAVAAAMVAAGCSGSAATAAAATTDPHQGPDQACGVCLVRGEGQILIGGTPVAFVINGTVPTAPGSGAFDLGNGLQPTTLAELQAANWPGTGAVGMSGVTVQCSREHGVLRAVVAGHNLMLGLLTAVVTDAGGTAPDTFSFVAPSTGLATLRSVFIPPSNVVTGEIHITELDRCQASCGPGLCLCPDDHLTCEACPVPPPPPPPPPPQTPQIPK